jgi:hypothetical protein
MTGIGNVAHIPNPVTQVLQVTIDHIESDIRPGMAQVAFAAYGWAANIHTHEAGVEGFKWFFLPGITIKNL